MRFSAVSWLESRRTHLHERLGSGEVCVRPHCPPRSVQAYGGAQKRRTIYAANCTTGQFCNHPSHPTRELRNSFAHAIEKGTRLRRGWIRGRLAEAQTRHPFDVPSARGGCARRCYAPGTPSGPRGKGSGGRGARRDRAPPRDGEMRGLAAGHSHLSPTRHLHPRDGVRRGRTTRGDGRGGGVAAQQGRGTLTRESRRGRLAL